MFTNKHGNYFRDITKYNVWLVYIFEIFFPIGDLVSLWLHGFTIFQSRIPKRLLSSTNSKAVNTAYKEPVFGVLLVRIFPGFSRIRTDPDFPAFGLNTEAYSVITKTCGRECMSSLFRHVEIKGWIVDKWKLKYE